MNVFWDRPTLKSRAKKVLSGTYWKVFGVLLLAGLFTGGVSSGSVGGAGSSFGASEGEELLPSLNSGGGVQGFLSSLGVEEGFITLFVAVFLATLVVGICAGILFGNVVYVGSRRFICLNRYRSGGASTLFFGFSRGRYSGIVKAMLLKGIYQFLWSLLLVFPGIIKSYSYWMVPYIMAENPGISASRAFEISKAATKGEKWRMFVFDLSFIGWYILGGLALGVGQMFVRPYVEAARAELYAALRYKAARTGICSPDEIAAELF